MGNKFIDPDVSISSSDTDNTYGDEYEGNSQDEDEAGEEEQPM
jgi:hypothetical protein